MRRIRINWWIALAFIVLGTVAYIISR